MPLTNLPLDQILHADCLEALGGLPEASVDLVFADPPYYLQLTQELFRPDRSKVDAVDDEWDKFGGFEKYDAFTQAWLLACRRVLKPTGTLWVIGTYHNIYRIGKILQDLDYWILNDIVWIKDNPMPNFRGVRFTNAHETLLWAQKTRGAKYTFNYQTMKALNDELQMRSDWYMPLCTGRERWKVNGEKAHTTQKPEGLITRVLLASTNPGDVVLDPFLGTGTTAVVAKKLMRHFIGIEQDEGYVGIARQRLSLASPLPEATLDLNEPRSRTRIPFGRLLEAGLLLPGQILTFARDENITAMVLANGNLKCNGSTGSIHALAKALVVDAPINGWQAWLYEEHGQKQPIDILRKKLQYPAGDYAQTN
jgi:site-specific DNA-methyltransferase (adenine-specific)